MSAASDVRAIAARLRMFGANYDRIRDDLGRDADTLDTVAADLEHAADYREVFGRDPEPWRLPLGALRLTLADESAPSWQLDRARAECEALVKVLNAETRDATRCARCGWSWTDHSRWPCDTFVALAPASPRDVMVATLVEHQRRDSESCLCGWDKLGSSHAAHQADAIFAALASKAVI